MGWFRPRHEKQDAAERRSRRGFRSYVFVLSCIFVVGSVNALFGEDGFLHKLRLRSEIRTLKAEVDLKRQQVDALKQDIQDLETKPMARERIAREQLGLALPDEYLFILPEEGSSAEDDFLSPESSP